MEKVADLSVTGPVLDGRLASPDELYQRLSVLGGPPGPRVLVAMTKESFDWLRSRADRELYPGRGTDEVGRDVFWCMDCRTTDEDVLDFMVYDTLWFMAMSDVGKPQHKPRGMICIDCFVRRLAAKGYTLTWRDLQPLEVNLKHRLRLEGNKE